VSESSAPSERRLGPFLLHTLLGRGGGGEAWAGLHAPTGTEVVVKRSLPGSSVSAQRLDREIAHTCQVDHPNLVRVLDARRHVVAIPTATATETTASARRETVVEPYLVVGRALRGTLADHPLQAHPEALATALLDALAGLAHLHARGLLHLDVKPANLFVHDDRGPGGTITTATASVQLGDLGASLPRGGRARASRSAASLMGTPGFSAPEHRAGDRARLGPWTDLWSLGATAWRLAGQTTPFADLFGAGPVVATEAARAAFAELPEGLGWLVPWVLRCGASEPQDRFASASEAATALRARGIVGDRERFSRVTRTPIPSLALTQAEDLRSRHGLRASATTPAHASGRPTWTQTASFVGALVEPPVARPRDSTLPAAISGGTHGREDEGGHAENTEHEVALDVAVDPEAAHDRGDDEERALPLGLGAGAAAVRRPPLVGRRVLRGHLRAHWQEVLATGQGRVVVLEGPAGAGLTRLAEWVGELAHESAGAAVLTVSLDEGGGGLAETLRRWIVGAGVAWGERAELGDVGGRVRGAEAAAAHVRARLRAEGLLGDSLSDDAMRSPLVEGFVALLLGRRRSAPQLAALFENFVRVLRERRPVVLAIDALDRARGPLTWVEHTTSQLIRPGAPTPAGRDARRQNGALVVVTQSTPLPAGAGIAALRLEPEAAAQVVVERVTPLDRFQTERLASRLLGFADHTSQEVAARSRGLPAHLVAHVATWLQQGILVTGPQGLSLALRPGEEPPAPPSLTDAALQRLTRVLGAGVLVDPVRLTLAVAALFDLDDVHRGGLVDEVLAELGLPALPTEALREAGLLLPTTTEPSDDAGERNAGLRWAAPGLGDVLLVDRPEAPAVYLACARALVRWGPGGTGSPTPETDGGVWDGTRGLALARWFARAKAPDEALATMARIRAVDLDPDIARGLLELLERLGAEWPSAEQAALSAALLARMCFERGDQERARLEARRARTILAGREHHAFARGARSETPVAASGAASDRHLALVVAAQLHALHVLALAQATEGQGAEEALAMAAEAEQWAVRAGARADELLTARSLRGRLLIMTSRSAEAIGVLQRAIDEGGGAAPPTLWRAWILLADACTNAGEPTRALPPIERAVAAMTAAGGHWMLGQAQNTLADGLMRQRRFDEALVPLRAALAEFYPRTPTAGYVRANIAFCCLVLGRLAEAETWVEEALARLATDARHRLWCLLQSLRLPLLAGREDAVRLDETITELERWLQTQRLIFAEPAEAATLAAEALPPSEAATRTRLLVLARRLTEHVEDESLRARLEPRWGALRGDD
jgi:tetratricopeptide (TPR) repeat protein